MLDAIKELLRGDTSVVFFASRVLIALAWAHTLKNIWKHRTLPGANQALAGALALIIIQALLIFDFHIPVDTVHAFLSAAHLVIAISYTKLLQYAGREQQCDNGTSCPSAAPLYTPMDEVGENPVRHFYTRMMVSLSLLGVMGMALRVWLT